MTRLHGRRIALGVMRRSHDILLQTIRVIFEKTEFSLSVDKPIQDALLCRTLRR
jgi:hypothetical protein